MKPYIIILNAKPNTSRASYGHAMLRHHLMLRLPHRLQTSCYIKTSYILSFTRFLGDKDLHLTAVIIPLNLCTQFSIQNNLSAVVFPLKKKKKTSILDFFHLQQAVRCWLPLSPYKAYDFLRHLLCPGHQMTWCPCAVNAISLLLFQSLEKKTLSNSQFPSEVLHCCYKAAIKSPEYAFCLYLQMVSHAIKIFCVSKKPDGKVVNTRIFYAPGQATSIPMCFSPLPIHKRRGVFLVK